MDIDTTVKMVESPDDWAMLAVDLENSSHASLDVETTPVPWHHPDYEVLTIAISTMKGHGYVIPMGHPENDVDNRPRLLTMFNSLKRQPYWIMQNGQFDIIVMAQLGIYLRTPWFDTMGAQYLIDVNAKRGLQAMAKQYLSVDEWKDVDYKKIDEEPLDLVARLNARDTDVTLRLYPILQYRLEDNEQVLLFDNLIMPAMETLAGLEMSGIPIDGDKLGDLIFEVSNDLDDRLETLKDATGNPKFNPGSYKQVGKYLYETLGLPIPLFTETGNPSTNAEALGKLAGMHPMVEVLQQWRSLKKLLSSSLLPWFEAEDGSGVLHPRYKVYGTATGRLASEKPNIQQVPREQRVRGVFGGVPGHKVVEVDYSQLELRIAAWVSGEEEMLAAFQAGEDLHQVTADALGVPRQTGKMANFGLLYGAGYRKLKWIAETQYGVDITEHEAQAIRARWFKQYSGIEDYHVAAVSEAETNGGITTALGRWRGLPEIYSADFAKKAGAERQAVNTPIQSLGSDITLTKLNELYRDQRLRSRGIRPLATVHDSILFLVPDEHLDMVTYIQQQMEDVGIFKDLYGVVLDVPLTTDAKIGEYWG
jgi:DNA polymerase-1